MQKPSPPGFSELPSGLHAEEKSLILSWDKAQMVFKHCHPTVLDRLGLAVCRIWA